MSASLPLGALSPALATQYRRAIFALVENADNWKNPIDATLPNRCDSDDMRAAIIDAVEFFTGSTPTFEIVLNRLRIRAAGYYAAVGA